MRHRSSQAVAGSHVAIVMRDNSLVCAGFYYFLSYCLLSLAALQVMPKPASLDTPAARTIDTSSHEPSPRTGSGGVELRVITTAGDDDEDQERARLDGKEDPQRAAAATKQSPAHSPVSEAATDKSLQGTPDYSMLRDEKKI